MESKKIFFGDTNKDVYLEIVDCESSEAVLSGDTGTASARPAVIICPGGGYFCVGTTEGMPVAEEFNKQGFAPFILNYSVMGNAYMDIEHPEDFPPVNDLSNAIQYLFDNADALNIISEEISIAAFSAGAHLALRYCLNKAKMSKDSKMNLRSIILVYPFLDLRYKVDKLKVSPDRSAEALFKLVAKRMFGNFPPTDKQYEMFSNIDLLKSLDEKAIQALPPIFIYHAKNDTMVPIQSSEDLIIVLKEKNVGFTAYICENGEHANPFYDPSWFTEAMRWYDSL